ncbi:MAG TPA: SRPBCC family protein [Ktedonobacterales bacterium]|jgi:uncharacterized membrane protein|nr:SRPBCC family protein [Ktedonobacterales bacterium]
MTTQTSSQAKQRNQQSQPVANPFTVHDDSASVDTLLATQNAAENIAQDGGATSERTRTSAPPPAGDWMRRGLAFASLGLGATCLLAPGRLATTVGLRDETRPRSALRLIGLREVTSGIGLLSGRRPTRWMWGRVAGDVMGLTLLGRAIATPTPRGSARNRPRAAGAMAALAVITAVDAVSATTFSLAQRMNALAGASAREAVKVHETVTVNRPAADLYALWRNPSNLPRIMRHLESVEETGDGRSHWKATAPAGAKVEWDAEIVEDRPNELIAWRSLPGAQVPNAGVVHFTPAAGDRGTEVHVELRYDPPAGKLGKTVAMLLGEEPSQQIADDLRRFKQVTETGELARSDASIQGKKATRHPAQPPKRPPAEPQPELTTTPSDSSQTANQAEPAQI